MKSQAVVLISIVGFALLCLLGLWWLKAETPPEPPVPEVRSSPPPSSAPPHHPAPPAHPEPVEGSGPPHPTVPPPSLKPPRLPTPSEKPQAPAMSPLPPNWDVAHLRFAHDAPTALEAIQPLVAECFNDNAEPLRPGAQVVLQFGIATDGRFEQTKVVSSTEPGPYLQACLQDALEDATTRQIGASAPRRYAFTLEADGGTEVSPAP